MTLNHILCVDDEELWRYKLQRHFKKNPANMVDLAKDYESALNYLHKTRYDLIVLDGLNGDWLKIYSDLKEIPHGEVVIISGSFKVELDAKEINSF
jgi:DNA-binding NarL/FixJ family response regulator